MAGAIVDRGFRNGISGFFSGIGSVFWGLGRLSRDSKLRGLAIIPFGLTILAYAIVVAVIVFATPKLLEWIRPEDPESWKIWIWWLIVAVAVLGMLAVAAVLFTAVVELVGGPFYDKMAAQLLDEHGIAWKDPGFVAGAVPDLIRSLVLAVPAVVCWALGFIPVVGIVFWFVGLCIACFNLGASAVNPALLMTGHSPGKRTKWMVRYLATTIGVGAVIAASMLLPFLGLVAIPSAVIGATKLYATTEARAPL